MSVVTKHWVLATVQFTQRKTRKDLYSAEVTVGGKLIPNNFHKHTSKQLIFGANHIKKTNYNASEVQDRNNNDLFLSVAAKYASGIQNGCSGLINTTKKAL